MNTNLKEGIFDDILKALGVYKKDDPKKADIVSGDVEELYSTLESAKEKGGIEQQLRKDLSYQKDVESFQIALELLGYDLPIYGVDGLFGPETAMVFKSFLKDTKEFKDSTKNMVGKVKVLPEHIDFIIDKLKSKNISDSDIQKYTDPVVKKQDNYGDVAISKKGQELLNDPIFSKRLEEISKNLDIQKEWLIKVMMKESGMDPYITNPIGCVGLIQFCPSTPRGDFKKIGNENVNLSGLKSKSPVYQLDLIEKYFLPYKGRITSYDDLYMLTFYPAAFGKPDSYVIGGQTSYGLKVSKQNPAIARAAGKTPGQDYLTVGDFKAYT